MGVTNVCKYAIASWDKCACVRVCVCVRARVMVLESERESEREREKEMERERERERERVKRLKERGGVVKGRGVACPVSTGRWA